VRISDEGDIYDCFAAAGVVIGHSSTALVEAAALGLPLYVFDDPASRLLMPDGLGTRFTSADELAGALARPAAPSGQTERFWARDWQANYRAFVERALG
jgi:hypothetical protein